MGTINSIDKQIQMTMEVMRPPVEIRDKFDIGYRFEDNTLEVFEIRPHGMEEDRIIERPVAKTHYVETQKVWKIYWWRASGKWADYLPMPEVNTIKEFFKVLDQDAHAYFWG